MLRSCLKVSAEVPSPLVSAGKLSAPIHKATVCLTRGHNLGVRYPCSLTHMSFPLISPSFSAATLVVLCLQPVHRQLGLPLISPSHPCSCQSVHPSINPSIHYVAKINPRTDNLSNFRIPLFFPLCPSITPLLYSSIHTSL